MSHSAVYPKAIYADNGVSGGSYTSGPPKLVIHTTETSGMPGYNNGLVAPHITYDPRTRIFVQHRTFKEAARALRNVSGGVETNRASALQIEIICYSSKPTADQQPYRDWVGDLDKIPGALEDLSEFVHWACTDWGIQKVWPGKQAFSYSEANAAGFRMTGAQWVSFNGVCGHQHVPENQHWDPGAIDWKKLLPEDDMTPAQEAKLDAVLAAIKQVPAGVANVKVKRAGQTISWIQETADIKSLLLNLSLDANTVSDAELDAAVTDLIAALPQKTLDLLKTKL